MYSCTYMYIQYIYIHIDFYVYIYICVCAYIEREGERYILFIYTLLWHLILPTFNSVYMCVFADLNLYGIIRLPRDSSKSDLISIPLTMLSL